MDVIEQELPVVEEKPKGIQWDKFRPDFDAKTFAKDMKEAGLTSHEVVTRKQREALGILRKHWQLNMATLNEFARGGK